MLGLINKGIIRKTESGQNFGYIIQDSNLFDATDYKVLKNQSSDIFVPCMQMLYNGKIQLFYIAEDYVPLTEMLDDVALDEFIYIVLGLFNNVEEVRYNGFLQGQNIDISFDKIYVEQSTLRVKLVYLPINAKQFDSYNDFEAQLRNNIIKIINSAFYGYGNQLAGLINDLQNYNVSLDAFCNKYLPAVKSVQRRYANANPNNNSNNMYNANNPSGQGIYQGCQKTEFLEPVKPHRSYATQNSQPMQSKQFMQNMQPMQNMQNIQYSNQNNNSVKFTNERTSSVQFANQNPGSMPYGNQNVSTIQYANQNVGNGQYINQVPVNNQANMSCLRLVGVHIPFSISLAKQKMVIGKNVAAVDIAINFSKLVSRKHCTIYNSQGKYFIVDEGSSNGTFVNGIRLARGRKIPIQRGDMLRIGDIDFQLM